MSINTTDKNADNVETLVDNTNEAITLVNEQLDESVLNNLTTENTDTLVNAINELNETKLDKNATQILNDFTINGHLSANSIAVNTDADGNSVVYFYDTTSSSYLKLFWNNSVQKYQLVFPDGSIVDIANSLDVADLQEQIDNISSSINYNFNTNGQTLILKQMSSAEIASYVGPAGEIVINSEEWGEIRVQDGTTVGGIVISGSVFVKWASNIEIKKGQCVYYGEGLYRAKTTHTTNDVFDISLYDTLAAYKKFVEVQTTTEETDTFTLKQSVGVANDFDVNIGGLVIQKSNITVIDDYHIKLSEKVPANTDVEITYFTASNVINSSITTNLFVAEVDDTTEIPLQEEVINSNAVHEVNIENTVLLNSEWSLAEGNQKIVLKNGVPAGTRVQVKFWKGVTVAQNGVTFTPSIVGGNTLTWENDGGLPNPDPISLMTQNSIQTINGAKTFTDIKVPTKDIDDSSSAAASTEFVRKVVDSAGGGLEIGDISFAAFGIDETKNKRRYLNGQVISQSQFESFTSRVKERAALYPDLITSEVNWQAEVTNSPYGICGKFVIDDDMGTIRLPKYPDWSIREVGQAVVVGNGMTLGLANETNIAGLYGNTSNPNNLQAQIGAYGTDKGSTNIGDSRLTGTIGVTTDPTKSGVIADLANANTEDKLQGKWFIQVATGVEESVDVTREIELNNPFSLLDYKWSEYELNNASWLLSNGIFHSGVTYVAVYELLLKIYNGTETKDGVSVKLSTEAYEDTDFVLNTDETTFRLPIKVKLASGNAVVGNGMALGLTDGTVNAGLAQSVAEIGLAAGQRGYGESVGVNMGPDTQFSTAYTNIGVTTDPTKSGLVLADNDMYLYFYVGETIQDANVIAASQVLTTIADCVRKSEADYVIESYNDDTNWYRVYKSGWVEQGGLLGDVNSSGKTINFLKPFIDTNYIIIGNCISANHICSFASLTKSSFIIDSSSSTQSSFNWEAKGQGE